MKPSELSPEYQPDGQRSAEKAQHMIDRALAGEIVAFEWLHKSADGRTFPCEVRLVGMPSADGRQVRGSVIDISARKRAEADMQLAAGVFDNTAEAICVTDADARIVRVNRAFTRITGYRPEQALHENPRLLRSGRHDQAFYETFWRALQKTGNWQGEIYNRRQNGEIFPCWQNVSAVRDPQGRCIQYISIFSDISDKKQTEAQLRRLAHYDVLTGLPNRLLFNERLEHALTLARRGKHEVALLFIDLDNFKTINDSLGHPVGDRVLCVTAERIQHVMRSGDTVARLSGDEFLVLLEDIARPTDAASAAQKLLDVMREPHEEDGQPLSLTASIGISMTAEGEGDSATLVKNADSALYHAKHTGRNNFQFYTPELTVAAVERLTVGAELRQAIQQNQFEVWYQPQWHLSDDTLFGAEALVRWRHPERGLVPPDAFIPIAEEQGLIGAIGTIVLETACADMRRWLDAGLRLNKIAVNVAGAQWREPHTLGTVQRMIERYRLRGDHLELEITESTIMAHTEQTLGLMESLKGLGVSISVDDFGTGYSSLSYLKRLPIDRLKIDRSFVMDLPGDSSDEAIVRAVIALGRSLNLRVLAEGVETAEQQHFLARAGCDEAQGYLVSAPMPAAEFERFMRRRGGRRDGTSG